MIYEQFIVSIVELIMLSWQPILLYNFHNMTVTWLFYHVFRLQIHILHDLENVSIFKGELQRQNKLLSAKRPFGVLQNETKIVKIRQAVLEIFNFKDLDLDSFTRKNDRKPKMLFF